LKHAKSLACCPIGKLPQRESIAYTEILRASQGEYWGEDSGDALFRTGI
jgi:hypothetical protein